MIEIKIKRSGSRITYHASRQYPPSFIQEDALEVHLQRLRVAGFGKSLFFADFPVLDQLEQGLIEGEHAVIGAGFDRGREFVEAIFFD